MKLKNVKIEILPADPTGAATAAIIREHSIRLDTHSKKLAWCAEQFGAKGGRWWNSKLSFAITFRDTQDQMLFELRWA